MEDKLENKYIRFIEVDGYRTRYYEAGEGEPLLLIHGGNFGSLYSLDCWSLNLNELAQSFHVIAWDKLGQGYTDNPKTHEDYCFPKLYEHTERFLKLMGLEKGLHLVGHSRGALLAAWLALENPGMAKSITLIDSNSLAPVDPNLSYDFYREIERRTPPGDPNPETVRLEPAANSYSGEHITDDFVKRMLECALLPKTQAAKATLKEVRESLFMPSIREAREDALSRIAQEGLPVKTQVIWGFNDLSAPLSLGLSLFERIARLTPECQLHVLNCAGHYVFREQAKAFNSLIKMFCLS